MPRRHSEGARDTAFRNAVKTYRMANVNAWRAMTLALPRGRRVSWRHGEHTRVGFVEECLGHSWATARVRVKSASTLKVYDVDAYQILENLGR